jgi:hypothetical protein
MRTTVSASSAASSPRPRAASITDGPDTPSRTCGKKREAVGRAREHRRAAEHVADADRDDRDAGRAHVDGGAQRARERELGGVGLVQPHAARGEQQHRARRDARPRRAPPAPQSASPCRFPTDPRRKRSSCAATRTSRPSSARRPGNDAVVVARRDAEAREIGARAGRRVERERARIRERGKACARFERGERDAVHRVV